MLGLENIFGIPQGVGDGEGGGGSRGFIFMVPTVDKRLTACEAGR